MVVPSFFPLGKMNSIEAMIMAMAVSVNSTPIGFNQDDIGPCTIQRIAVKRKMMKMVLLIA